MSAFDPTPLRPDAPAMPVHGGYRVAGDDPRNRILGGGLTARQHAAIALRVPDSGTEWLDKMICASLRDQFAVGALNAILMQEGDGIQAWSAIASGQPAAWGREAYAISDAMLAVLGAS